MNKQTVIALTLGLVLVGALTTIVSWRGVQNRIALTGEVVKVHVHQIEPANTLAALHVRLTNPSPQQLLVDRVEVMLVDDRGEQTGGKLFSEMDARGVLDFYKELGGRSNQTLMHHDKINGGQSVDRMIVVQFGKPESIVAGRKHFRIVIHDEDGAKLEVIEQK